MYVNLRNTQNFDGDSIKHGWNCQNEAQATKDMGLLGHEAELNDYSLELLAS